MVVCKVWASDLGFEVWYRILVYMIYGLPKSFEKLSL